MNDQDSKIASDNYLDGVVAQANQLANMILLALRTVHEYIEPRAASHGIKLSAREKHAWAVSLSIALSQSKAHQRMPATRLSQPATKKAPAKSVASPKNELFPRSAEQPPAVPFSDPAIAPALRKLRQLLQRDSVTEPELLAILRESAPRQTLFLDNLEQIPEGPLLCAYRDGPRSWSWSKLSATTMERRRE